MSSGLYSHTTRGAGTILTASIYNSDHTTHITNANPSMHGAYSDSVAQMQAKTSPGGLGSEVLPTSLAGELERIRFALNRIVGKTHWYEAPTNNLENIPTLPIVTAGITAKAVTYPKIQDITVTQRVLGRNTAAAGVTEEVTLTQLLDWIGSAARGDILVRGAANWAKLAIGGANTVLRSNGTDPAWVAETSGLTVIETGSLPAAANKDIINIPATYAYLILQITGVSMDTSTRDVLVQVDTDNGASFDTTPGNYLGYTVTGGSAAIASLIATGTVTNVTVMSATAMLFGYQGGPNMMYKTLGGVLPGIPLSGTYVGATAAINAIRILVGNGSGNFDAGTYTLYGAR